MQLATRKDSAPPVNVFRLVSTGLIMAVIGEGVSTRAGTDVVRFADDENVSNSDASRSRPGPVADCDTDAPAPGSSWSQRPPGASRHSCSGRPRQGRNRGLRLAHCHRDAHPPVHQEYRSRLVLAKLDTTAALLHGRLSLACASGYRVRALSPGLADPRLRAPLGAFGIGLAQVHTPRPTREVSNK